MTTETCQGALVRRKAAHRPSGAMPSPGCARNRLAMVGLVTGASLLFIIALIGPFIAPYPYYAAGLDGGRWKKRPAVAGR